MRREPVTGLPRPVERRLMQRYGRTTAGRVGLAAAVKALAVLVKRHPRAAFDAATAAAVSASRVGVQGLTERLGRFERPAAPARPRLSKREVRAFVRLLGADADPAAPARNRL